MAEANFMYDNEFYDMILKLKKKFEDEMSTIHFDVNDTVEESVNMMNMHITDREVGNVLSHAKKRKTCMENLPNEKPKRLLTQCLMSFLLKHNSKHMEKGHIKYLMEKIHIYMYITVDLVFCPTCTRCIILY